MTKEEWYKLQEGDIIQTKTGRDRLVVSTSMTTGGSKRVILDSGTGYCTGERYLFNKPNYEKE